MEYTTIKTSPGKMYSAISPSSCTIKTEDGDLVQYIEANKQQYFIAPDAKLVSDNNELLLTECTS